jgi:hypothetical protein
MSRVAREPDGTRIQMAFPPAIDGDLGEWASKYPLQQYDNSLPLPMVDPREASIRVLRNYLSKVKFKIEDGGGGTTLQIPESRIFTEWPDAEDFLVGDVTIAFLAAEGGAEYGSLGLGGPVLDTDTEDLYAPNTVVFEHSAYTEDLRMRVVCADRVLRRGIIAGIESAMNPFEEVVGLRFWLPDYYGRLARVLLTRGGRIDGEESIKNRRVVDFTLRLYTVCATLVKRPLMVPSADVSVE